MLYRYQEGKVYHYNLENYISDVEEQRISLKVKEKEQREGNDQKEDVSCSGRGKIRFIDYQNPEKESDMYKICTYIKSPGKIFELQE